jgi:hypothetical protein
MKLSGYVGVPALSHGKKQKRLADGSIGACNPTDIISSAHIAAYPVVRVRVVVVLQHHHDPSFLLV